MIKTILVAATGNDSDAATFAAALAIARPFAAHLDMLHVKLDPVNIAVAMTTDAGGGALTAGLIEQLEQDSRSASEGPARSSPGFAAAPGSRRTAAPTPASARRPRPNGMSRPARSRAGWRPTASPPT